MRALGQVSVLLVVVSAVLAGGLAVYDRVRARRGRPVGDLPALVVCGVVLVATAAVVAFLVGLVVVHVDDLPWDPPWWIVFAPGAALLAVGLGLAAGHAMWPGRRRGAPTSARSEVLLLGAEEWARSGFAVLLGGLMVGCLWWPFRQVHHEEERYAAAPVIELHCRVTERYEQAVTVPAGDATATVEHDLVGTDRCGPLENIDAAGRAHDDVRAGDCFTVEVRDARPPPRIHPDAREVVGGRYHGNVGRHGDCPLRGRR